MPASPIVIAQLNPTVGDIAGNTTLIQHTLDAVRKQYNNALIIFPEMMICGYCPQDLLLRSEFIEQCQEAVLHLSAATHNMTVVLGSPFPLGSRLEKLAIANSAIVYQNGEIIEVYAKQQLPNYAIFDEKRYFSTQNTVTTIQHNNQSIGILVCEDGWKKESYQSFIDKPVDLIVSLNASPFEKNKRQQRLEVAKQIHRSTQAPLVYTNLVGGQDELVFDGGSFVINTNGEITQIPQFQTGAFVLDADTVSMTMLDKITITHPNASESLTRFPPPNEAQDFAQTYSALGLGLRDYVLKNRFPKVLLGLSGGIDSALTCALATDALGADKVISMMIASPYTSQLSIDLAEQQAALLGIEHHHINLLEAMESVENTLLPIWRRLPEQKAISRQNIQARLRGVILMALSNEYNALLLATGNKSELSVGYATLYGDMAGGFSPIKDVYKTVVYQLSEYRNKHSLVIPQAVINRPPTAELAPDQKDIDNLPEYAILDAILEKFIEQRRSAEQIIEQGYQADIVHRTIQLVLKNQHKRQQASIGTKITATAFGRDFRYPNTQRWQ